MGNPWEQHEATSPSPTFWWSPVLVPHLPGWGEVEPKLPEPGHRGWLSTGQEGPLVTRK